MEQQRSTLAIHSHQFCIAEVEMFEKSPDFEMRKLRNIFLRSSDWTQMADSPLTAEKKAEWATYRQALRDLPNNSTPTLDDNGNLVGVVLPTQPE